MLMPMEQRTRPKHFSMIRGFHLADFFTLANAACGVGAVFLTMLYLQSGAGGAFLRRRHGTPRILLRLAGR
jgi:hypothetical protein